jgi:hypothetical protein
MRNKREYDMRENASRRRFGSWARQGNYANIADLVISGVFRTKRKKIQRSKRSTNSSTSQT